VTFTRVLNGTRLREIGPGQRNEAQPGPIGCYSPAVMEELTFDQCARAMIRRDPAYDGLFFVAVKTTGIYCRPVCTVKTPKLQNVEFVQTAAAAEAAGYRPCLRCRPETAPFSPAWNGTRTTVTRALRLISESVLDTGSIVELSDRLGATDRHLRRLFARHIGASPSQTAQTLRLQKAKRLLNNTDYTVTQVAFEAGYHSLGAFTRAFTSTYGRTPSTLRKTRSKPQL